MASVESTLADRRFKYRLIMASKSRLQQCLGYLQNVTIFLPEDCNAFFGDGEVSSILTNFR